MKVDRSIALESSKRDVNGGTFTASGYIADKARFYARTLLPNDKDCMIWVGSKIASGYGQLCKYKEKPRSILAHRFSYRLHYGEFNQGLHVLHRCDTPSCVAPEHLFLGTPKDNSNDKINKGRANNHNPKPGQENPAAKLNDNDVREIKRLLSEGVKGIPLAKSLALQGKL
tara:strand:- start:156 stop:668 length:513 start_codon:yes stop_codon:yes gene_type:complete